MKSALFLLLPGCLALPFLLSCGGAKKNPAEAEAGMDISAEVDAYYKADPEFFTFATIADLPDDLVWENGMDEPEMGSPEAIKGGTFNFYTADFPRTLRLVGPDASMGFRSYLLDDNGGPNGMALTVRHPDTLNQIPCIASEWAIGEDKKTVYYRIDPEARYSDGVSVTADDYFFMFFFMRSPHLKAPWYNDYYKTKFTNITKFDERTLSLTYSEAKPDVVYSTSMRPVPRHFYNAFGEDYLERYNFRSEPTTGPYEVRPEGLKKGQSVTMEKVKNWWAKDKKFYKYRYNPDRLRFQVIREPAKAFEVFRSGEIDWYSLTLGEDWHKKLPNDAPEVASGMIEKIWFYNVAPRPSWGIRLNRSRPPLDDINVRIGVQQACNWDLVIEKVFYGDFERMNSVADGYGEMSHPDLKARPFDPALAEEHFAKAGFTNRGPDGILMNANGQRLSLTLTTGYKRFEDAFTVLKQEAKKAGLEINLEVIDYTAALKKADEKKHQMSFAALNVGVELYPRFWETYHSYHAYTDPYGPNRKLKTDTNNDTVTAEKDIDDMIDAYRAAGSLEDIKRLSHQLIARLHEDAAFIPAWKQPFYRMGKWRWLRFPEDYHDQRSARLPTEMHVFWIDEEMKKETLEAKKSGQKFPPVIKVYDQHKQG